MTDFIGNIGKLHFVTGEVAFKMAAKAQKEKRFSRPVKTQSKPRQMRQAAVKKK